MKGEGMDKVREALEKVTHMLARYVSEVPLGHQPHMAALEAEALVREAREALCVQPAEPVPLHHIINMQWAYAQACDLADWANAAGTALGNEEKLYQAAVKLRDTLGKATHAQPAPSVPAAWVACAERMPASGVTVLACYTNSAGNVRRIRAEWVAAKTIESDADSEISEYDEATDCYYDPEGWYEKIDNWGDYSSVAVVEGEITHWTPLPAAPHPAAKGAES